jgi:RNA polymerase subunit RPABC4/transcription elongation factor Spt4
LRPKWITNKMGEMTETQSCKVCGENISSDAKICPKCNSLLRFRWRTFWRGAASIIKVLAAVATATSIIFMVISQDKTRTQLEQTQKQIELQTLSINTMADQLKAQQEANTINRNNNVLLREQIDKQYREHIEVRKPNLSLSKLDILANSDSTILYYNLSNIGQSKANNPYLKLAFADSNGITQAIGMDTLPDLNPEGNFVKPEFIQVVLKPNNNYIVKTIIGWNWEDEALSDSVILYRMIIFRDAKNISIKILGADDIPKILLNEKFNK